MTANPPETITKNEQARRAEINLIARSIYRGDTILEPISAPLNGPSGKQLPPDELSTRLEQSFLAAVGFSGLAVTHMLAAKRTQNPIERNQEVRTAIEYAQRHETAQRRHDAIRDEFDARRKQASGRFLGRGETYRLEIDRTEFFFDLILIYTGTGDFLTVANAEMLEFTAGKPALPRAWIDLARWVQASASGTGRPREDCDDLELIFREDHGSLTLRSTIKKQYAELPDALEVIRITLKTVA